MHAIRLHAFGPPQNLRYQQVPDLSPGGGQVRIVVEASGVHVIDTMLRRGLAQGPLPLPDLPMTPGREVAGVVDAFGPGGEYWIGRRVVAHLGRASGGYAEYALAPVDALFEVPPGGMSAEVAVAMIGTGRTAVGILELAKLTADDVVLVTAAAGGLGALFVQAIARMGATSVALAGGEAKVGRAREIGATIAVDYREPDWPAHVREALDDRLPSVLLDGVGGDITPTAIGLLGAEARVVQFGWSSGVPVAPRPDEVAARRLDVVDGIGERILQRPGGLRPLVRQALAYAASGYWMPLLTRFPLREAAGAHGAVETRATIGKTLLVP